MATKRLIDSPRALLAGAALAVVGAGDAQAPRPVAAGPTAQPHAVVPRGPLSADERNTIAVFESVSPSVVLITTVQHVRDFFSRNVMRVPQGTGSGFIWDEQGHVVTNFHVIRGAQEALVRLGDQRSFPRAARRREPRARSRRAADRRRRRPAARRLRSAAARSCVSARPCSRSAIRSASITR